jgi:hypothetical protein
MSAADYTGQVINGITFVERIIKTYDSGRRTYSNWRVICRCGGEFKATAYQIKQGRGCGFCHAVRRTAARGALATVENEALLELVKTGGSRSDVAKALSAQLGSAVTKNMVTGRLWRMGATVPKPLPKRPVPWLPAGACAFPLGHPTEDDFRYCCDVVAPGRVYCERHHKLTHLRES